VDEAPGIVRITDEMISADAEVFPDTEKTGAASRRNGRVDLRIVAAPGCPKNWLHYFESQILLAIVRIAP